MVLTLRRAAFVALIIGMPLAPTSAQQPAAPVARLGDVRPLLYGFALECIECPLDARGRGRGGAGRPPLVLYKFSPHVIAVAPGSAAEQAGVRAGDILQSIDGLPITTDSGASRLAHAAAGQQVRLAFDRNAKPVVVSLTLGAKPAARATTGQNRVYGGYIAMEGSTAAKIKLEVWSDDPIVPEDPVMQTVSPGSDSTGTIILRIGTNTVIKLQLTKNAADSSKKRPDDEDPDKSRADQPRLSSVPEMR
ncbi:MAG TPA: PDZ domain-containing protein [Gemmatimonadaceae bacterium]|jgi:membrane-associated protease RseP (regulator of RpoE activity)